MTLSSSALALCQTSLIFVFYWPYIFLTNTFSMKHQAFDNCLVEINHYIIALQRPLIKFLFYKSILYWISYHGVKELFQGNDIKFPFHPKACNFVFNTTVQFCNYSLLLLSFFRKGYRKANPKGLRHINQCSALIE